MTAGTLVLAAAAAMQFNLVCTGEQSHVLKIFGPRQGVSQIQTTYRVDLAKNRFCKDSCDQTQELAKVSETRIIFELEEAPNKEDWNDYIEFVNRENGDWRSRRRVSLGAETSVFFVEGTCARAPFTGFPSLKF